MVGYWAWAAVFSLGPSLPLGVKNTIKKPPAGVFFFHILTLKNISEKKCMGQFSCEMSLSIENRGRETC